ncbi:MAG: peptidase M28 family protein [Robiginitomaculum sp.]|nr:MAG: peptidase M28 family protein [Robiginitomaculum sp.]
MNHFKTLLISSALLVGLPGATLAGDSASTAKILIEKAQESTLGWDIVESLTTEVGPRLAGSDAEARARDWAVKKLNALGFANVHVEPFEMEGWQRGSISVMVGDPYPQRLVATALGRSIGTPVGGITAPVVRFETLQDLRDAKIGSLKGKIAFVDSKMTRTQRGSGYGQAVQKRSAGASIAAERGALALLIRSAGTDYQRNGHTGGLRYDDEQPRIPAAALSNNDADQLGRLLVLKADVPLSFSMSSKRIGTVTSGNVIADIVGSEYPDEIVLLGAHLDSWDEGTGAIDDGTGVAIVTAAATLVARHAKPKRTIRVVLFGAEEPGLIGAKAYVAKHKDDLDKIIMVSESDFGSGRIWRMDTGIAKEDEAKADDIQRVLAPLGVLPGARTASGGSDVSALSAAGTPAITMGQNGWKYFDLHHTPNDTLDKVDPDDLAQNIAVYAAFALMVANTEGGFHPPAEPASEE